jgi:hypothetical protein
VEEVYFFQVTDLHSLKASNWTVTLLSELSIVMSRFVQFLNAYFIIVVTLDGISTLVKPSQPSNAELEIVVTVDGTAKLPLNLVGHLTKIDLSLLYKTPATDA